MSSQLKGRLERLKVRLQLHYFARHNPLRNDIITEPLVAPIIFNVDREKRRATIRIEGIAETDVEPIRNPATGEERRARIVLPNGFEFKEAEMGNTLNCHVSAGDKLTFELKNTYAQLNAFDWSN